VTTVRAALGESPLWPAAAIVASAALYADLPSRFIVGSGSLGFSIDRWAVPALTLVLLAALAYTLPMEFTERLHQRRRWISLSAIGLLSLANGGSILWLVHLLVNGAHANASSLLRAAVHMWVVNVLIFALWYWQLDGGGPVERPKCAPHDRDFLFPQQTETTLLEGGWRPLFLDYVYVSFTNAAAFSPTDTMPLSRWAKMLMLVQSAMSLSLAVMVVARAVNILR
jgi:hypothetical protein